MIRAIIGILAYTAINRIAVEYRIRKVCDCSYQDAIAQSYEDAGDAVIWPKDVYMILDEVWACTFGIPYITIGLIQEKLDAKNK